MDDNDKYSLDCGIFSPLVLETPFVVVVEINSVVDNSESIEESVYGNDTAGVDKTTVEVDDTNSSVVRGFNVFIVVPSVELIRFSFVGEIELNKDSVDSE